ncbi:hypothetical protein CC80DRAFT_544464 [Byssothecium circinans]|uniref:BTB domain-containing protein n=1 Tax=Byssothecium circinans TaxID=147558 RepID=A0A6A5U554_9PLEO|nr:hypothetical protein CC80DRAFT_544464 [Byssothecium circinans]
MALINPGSTDSTMTDPSINIRTVTIDPNGDALLILQNPLHELPEWDGMGGIVVAPPDGGDADEWHYLVSSNALRITSSYFRNIFTHSFLESECIEDGKYQFSVQGFSGHALGLVLYCVHMQTAMVPKILDLRTRFHDLRYDEFERTAHCLLRRLLKGECVDLGLRTDDIIRKVEACRINLLKNVFDAISSEYKALTQPNAPRCSDQCDTALLGIMIMTLGRTGILVSGDSGFCWPENQYEGMNLQDALNLCQRMRVLGVGDNLDRRHVACRAAFQDSFWYLETDIEDGMKKCVNELRT